MKTKLLLLALLWGAFSFAQPVQALTISGTGTINTFIIGNQIIPINELKSRTVVVYQRNAEGHTWISAGVSINKRQVLTVYHAVTQEDIYVQRGEGKAYIAHIIKKDEAHDLALLDIGNGPDMIETPLPLGEPTGPLVTIGHPNGNKYTLTTGSRGHFQQTSYLIPLQMEVQGGNSGGGVLNAKGELVGLIESTMDSIKDAAFMVSMQDIQTFLKEG